MLRLMTDKKLRRMIQVRLDDEAEQWQNARRQEGLQRQADLEMLQAQINPHFLYNALECIRGQAIASGVPDIAETAQALSGYFRYTISLRENIVTLYDELANVRNYVRVQKYRFGDRFNLKIDIDADSDLLSSIALPKLTLQPLVENAILHAFDRGSRQDPFICITLEETAAHVNIHIMDNGRGIPAQRLNQLNAEFADPSVAAERTGHGIALLNVHRRLEYAFGSGYGLAIASVEDMGTDVEIHIPQRTVEEVYGALHGKKD